MYSPLSRIAVRLAYGARQLPRVAWYVGHGLAMRRLAKAAPRRDGALVPRRRRTTAPVPDRTQIYADMAVLLRQDLANVEAGFYPLPADHDGPLLTLLHRSELFFKDLPEVHRRRESGAHSEVLDEHTIGTRPHYYLQNFHFQSGGWMTEESAERYDTQVEVLFNGMANAIRRQALPQLQEVFAGRDQRKLRLLDIGCGTSRFLDQVKQVWPRLACVGLDLSEPYTRHAKRQLRRWSVTDFLVGNAEAIPLADASCDAVTSVFVFHELPPEVRRTVFRECARVLKPGGRFVLVDSLQHGDRSDYDGLLKLFPQNYHEPYYSTYITERFDEIAEASGLAHVRDLSAFVSKVMIFDKTPTHGCSAIDLTNSQSTMHSNDGAGGRGPRRAKSTLRLEPGR
jgi:ubiquinone/menaquinone biosynthesis C-methylase UbiE